MKEKSEERNELQINRGKKPNQKLKPYLVLQFLLRETDENNVVTADDIVAYLNEIGIDAERRSVYKDIEEIIAVCRYLHRVIVSAPASTGRQQKGQRRRREHECQSFFHCAPLSPTGLD